jgi:hypothetical protein
VSAVRNLLGLAAPEEVSAIRFKRRTIRFFFFIQAAAKHTGQDSLSGSSCFFGDASPLAEPTNSAPFTI